MTINIDRIRINGGQAQPGWNPASYEIAVRRVVMQLQVSNVGTIVLNALRRLTTIVPNDITQPRNASMDVARPHTDDQYAAGYRAYDHIYHCGNGTPTMNRRLGTGLGAPGQIWYTPGQWIPASQIYQGNPGGPISAGAHADEVLLHEMVHAVRITMGIGDCRPLSGSLSGYDNYSEFYAVLVENVYSSEKGNLVRRDHHGHATMSNEATWYAQSANKLMTMNFCRSMQNFTRDLAGVEKAKFNPFRQFYQEMGVAV